MTDIDDAARNAIEQDEELKKAREMVANVKETTMSIYRAALFLKAWENALINAGFSATEAFSMASMMQGYFLEEAGV